MAQICQSAHPASIICSSKLFITITYCTKYLMPLYILLENIHSTKIIVIINTASPTVIAYSFIRNAYCRLLHKSFAPIARAKHIMALVANNNLIYCFLRINSSHSLCRWHWFQDLCTLKSKNYVKVNHITMTFIEIKKLYYITFLYINLII